jgi:hypothetical protein
MGHSGEGTDQYGDQSGMMVGKNFDVELCILPTCTNFDIRDILIVLMTDPSCASMDQKHGNSVGIHHSTLTSLLEAILLGVEISLDFRRRTSQRQAIK